MNQVLQNAPLQTNFDPVPSRLLALGIVLPAAPKPIGNFITARLVDNMLYLSGQGPLHANGVLERGKVGQDVSVEQAYQHARLSALNLLAVAKDHLGSLDRVRYVVKILGLVNAAPDFDDHPRVINGCSDLFVEIFGENIGRGARSAMGMGSLPNNQTVEIEAIFAVHPA
jgi:enamine deaminase RidA (YjgF/YER057c/UK114 family)